MNLRKAFIRSGRGALFAVAAALAGCAAPPEHRHAPPIATDSVVRALEQDTLDGLSPDGSPSYASVVGAPGQAPIGALRARCIRGGPGALLPMLALRRIAPPAYDQLPVKVRAAILASALLSLTTYNAFELPAEPLSEASEAAVALGPGAVGGFLPLLFVERPVRVLGSRVAREAELAELEVRDFALGWISLILRRPYDFDRSRAKRDVAARDLTEWLVAHPDQWN